jgi:hypothetical protein
MPSVRLLFSFFGRLKRNFHLEDCDAFFHLMPGVHSERIGVSRRQRGHLLGAHEVEETKACFCGRFKKEMMPWG